MTLFFGGCFTSYFLKLSDLTSVCLFSCVGPERWPRGVFLKFTYGDQLGPITFLLVNAVEPMECSDVSVEMISPASDGIYQAQWRMCTPMGQYFGGKFYKLLEK